MPNPANPQSFNRYSYVYNNPLRYTDPTGLAVEFANEEEILEYLEIWNESGDPMSPYWEEIIDEWAELRQGWEDLKQEEPEYMQHMEESDIIFEITDIDLPTQTVSYHADIPLISFNEPVQLQFVSGFQMAAIMYGATRLPLSPGGVSLYPDPIYIRTDIDRSTQSFTNLVAHESYHAGNNLYMWMRITGTADTMGRQSTIPLHTISGRVK